MQSMITLKLCSAALVAVALSATLPAEAAPPSAPATPEMQRAFAKADQGAEQLRWYVHRTRSIYNLDFYEVMVQYEVVKVAQADEVVRLAAIMPR